MAFRATLDGLGLTSNTMAVKLFAPGPTLNVSRAGAMSPDFIGPGVTAIYRIGCALADTTADVDNLVHPMMRVGPSGDESGGIDEPVSNWSPVPPVEAPVGAHTEYDTRTNIISDTTIAVTPARHSLRLNIPTSTPVVFPLPGTQLVPTAQTFAPTRLAKVGDQIVGSSVTLPGGSAFRVTLMVQASPCGTNVSLMAGAWVVSHVECLHDTRGFCVEELQGVYHGAALSTATPCGLAWTTLSSVVRPPPGIVNGTNGTALQIRFVAPETERNWGATVWIGQASVTAL